MSRINAFVGIASGIFILLGIHTAVFIFLSLIQGIASILKINSLALFTNYILIIEISFIGIAQILYVIPLVIIFSRQQRWEVMKGVIIGAVITALLNGGCWLLLPSLIR